MQTGKTKQEQQQLRVKLSVTSQNEVKEPTYYSKELSVLCIFDAADLYRLTESQETSTHS